CAALLKENSLAPRFVMVGDGNLRQECEARIQRKGLHEVVFLTGWRRDLPAIYSDLDFVVATSLNEGTPVALLEAMASAKAIVSTDVGGVRDLMVGSGQRINGMEIFENGILVQCDTRKLAQAVEYLINNKLQSRAMGRAGREFVRRRFSHLRLADDLAALYQLLAKTRIRSTNEIVTQKDDLEAALLSSDKTVF